MTLISRLKDKKHSKVIDTRKLARKKKKKNPKNFFTSKCTLKVKSE